MSLQRLIGLAGYGGNGNGNKQVQPTFGVSFGLPQPSHGGYPINPFNSNPVYNPYGPALNGGGLNLGLISVNPLLAVQVTKNDYGDKVVKPFVNLHVTPNEHVVNKLGHLFHEKKHYLLNKHEHYHHHQPYGYNHHYPHKPIHHVHAHNLHPPHYGPPPPVYSPHFSHYEPSYSKLNPYSAHDTAPGNDDYYDDENDDRYNYDQVDYNPYQSGYSPGFERSANTSKQGYADRYAYSRSLTLPSKNPGASRGGQSIRFPENRRKREVAVDNPTSETIEEVTYTDLIQIPGNFLFTAYNYKKYSIRAVLISHIFQL